MPGEKGARGKRNRLSVAVYSLGSLAVVSFMALMMVVSLWPAAGAQGADLLRAVFGDQAVAQLEMIVFRGQDAVQQAKFKLGLAQPAVPWQVTTTAATAPAAVIQAPTATLKPTCTLPASINPATSTASPETDTDVKIPAPVYTPTPAEWLPANLPPLGILPEEGVWVPYLQDAAGRNIAFRAFLQPDPERPYAFTAVVAFDLRRCRLHYVLGTEEPYSADSRRREGRIPAADLQPGRLLATFNGGFKATHGHFGAMADGVEALPPRDGIGTLAIYQDGRVRMGLWGREIVAAPDLAAWRENGPLVVQAGQINPQIYNNSPKDWGYTVDDVSPTLRSAIGLSQDGNTLYYLVGPKLTMEALAKSLLGAGAWWGLQLDINNFWVHFAAIRAEEEQLTAEPLLPEWMKEKPDRYLHAYPRDFFYITGE